MKRHAPIASVTNWRTRLTPEERKKRYRESIPAQVYASMAFEGEPVSLKMLKEYLKSLKNIPQPHGS
jgi:CO dehydrogenase/acetyl-CoA synthase beta subunit